MLHICRSQVRLPRQIVKKQFRQAPCVHMGKSQLWDTRVLDAFAGQVVSNTAVSARLHTVIVTLFAFLRWNTG